MWLFGHLLDVQLQYAVSYLTGHTMAKSNDHRYVTGFFVNRTSSNSSNSMETIETIIKPQAYQSKASQKQHNRDEGILLKNMASCLCLGLGRVQGSHHIQQ